MRFTKVRFLLATMCVMAMATVAFAATSWTDLSEAQQQKFMSLQKDFGQKSAPVRDALWAKRMELNAAINTQTPDSKVVAQIVDEMNVLRNQMRTQRATFDAAVQKEVGLDPNVSYGSGRGYHGGGHGGGCNGYANNNRGNYGHNGGHNGYGRGMHMRNNAQQPVAPAN